MSNNNSINLLIIADDFTGANDTGVQLTKKGAKVDVYFDWSNDFSTSHADVIVINTDSRAITQDKAQIRIKELIRTNNINYPLYKKIDSTLRGNIGAEISALLTETDYEIALIASAFPDMNRIVKNGICFVNNVELIDTEFASDPKTPIFSSRIKSCITQQTDLLCEELSLDIVRSLSIKSKIDLNVSKGVQLFVIDTETNHDLELIAKQIAQLNQKVLLVGSAGLMNFLPTNYTQNSCTKNSYTKKDTSNRESLDKQKEHMLVIAGSMSKTTQKQIEHAANLEHLWQVIDINITDFLPHFSDEKCQHYCEQIQLAFNNNKNCIVRTCKDDSERHQIDKYCQKYKLTRQYLGEHIANSLGKIVKNIAINNLFLTGGDVAISIAKSLGATGFHIEGEVASGVPYGKLIGNVERNYRIFTKAGGFGEQDIFTNSLDLI